MNIDDDDMVTPIAPRPETFLDRALRAIAPWEGNVNFMYLDGVGRVTCGVGFMLPSVEAALRLPFVPRDAVASDFAAVSALPPNKVAAFYRPHTKSTLSAPAIRAEFEARCTAIINTLEHAWPAWPRFPEPARLALVDMGYNMGASELLSPRDWPSLGVAVRAQNWPACAAQCHRRDIQNARNSATAARFLEAHTLAMAGSP